MATQIFLNIPVKDLQRSIAFFTKLGYTFNPKFTDENATCMIVSDTIFVMLLNENRFRDFTDKTIIDAHKHVEMITAISVESRAKVDELVNKAIEEGATEPKPSQDYGWMYYRQFHDLDGHVWEILFADESQIPQ